MRIFWILAVLLSVTLSDREAAAQVPLATAGDDAAPAIEQLIEAARQEGYRVLLVPPEAAPAGAGETAATAVAMEDQAVEVRRRLRWVLSGLPEFPGHFADFLDHHSTGLGTAWPLLLILLTVVFLGIGYGVERWYAGWARTQFTYIFKESPDTQAERIAYLMSSAILKGVGVLIQAAVAAALVIATDIGEGPGRATGMLTVIAVASARLITLIFEAMLAPGLASHRLPRLDDAAARSLFGGLRAATWFALVVAAICLWMGRLGLDLRTHYFILILAVILITVFFAVLVVRHRQVVAGMILGPAPPDGLERPLLQRLLARTWHVLAAAYLVAAMVISIYRMVLGDTGAGWLVLAPIIAGVAGLILYGTIVMAIDRVFRRRGARVLASPEDAGGGGEAAAATPPRLRTFRDLLEHAAGLLVVVVMIWALLSFWGVDLLARTGAASAAIDILVVMFLAYVAFQAVKIAIDNKIAEEGGGPAEEGEMPDEGGGAGASRLATLLPIFRNFLLIVIASIAGMVILSELGVDIAPLFAGAGVVGLAIGFGAQTLIQDIFSGAFFLMDDAFRKGEYIEIGNTRGTVERISIRSMQLRHQLGRLHTIPFGQIQSLTNYSRDWVMMKLPLRVTYDTDVEKVRKLIKNLGQELLQDPVIGDKFLEPLKSQGVYMMEDSAMIIRVKFMTRPGDQFMARKTVYQRIREVFAEHGIRFAHREVTVRLADGPDRSLTDAEKEAVAGAVRPVIDPPANPGTGDQR